MWGFATSPCGVTLGGQLEPIFREQSHRRFNPLTSDWVLVSPHRTQRPWQGAIERLRSSERPRYDPSCYLCPRNQRARGVENPDYPSTFLFENDFAALKSDGPRAQLDFAQKGLLVAETEQGICQVMCFSPRHDLTLATMSVPEIEEVVRTWILQSRDLAVRPGISHVQIFENRGEMMGASNPHPHCQIWATATIPDAPRRELAGQRNYHHERGSCLLCDYVALEESVQERLVIANEGFIALVPFWAVWPFEIMIASRRHTGGFPDLVTPEIAQLSAILRQVVSTYDRVFDVPFPYSMGFHQAPCDHTPHPEWHFHAHFYPPLLRSATVRKFMVGFEMLGTAQRDITPELAAEKLHGLATP
jgi:UDPglucose--hexose-1-phosphate uridylyltransferase